MLETVNKIVQKSKVELETVQFRKAESIDESCFVCKKGDEIDGTCFCMKFMDFVPDMRTCNFFEEV
jgi:hypothetical protein